MSIKILNQQRDYSRHYIIWAPKKLSVDEKRIAISRYLKSHPEIEPYEYDTVEFDVDEILQWDN